MRSTIGEITSSTLLTLRRFLHKLWRNIVKDKGDAIFVTLIHDGMFFLVVDLVRFAKLKLIRPPVDHEPHPRIRCNRNVNAVAFVKGLMLVNVRRYFLAREKLRGHRTNHCSARWIESRNNVVHYW